MEARAALDSRRVVGVGSPDGQRCNLVAVPLSPILLSRALSLACSLPGRQGFGFNLLSQVIQGSLHSLSDRILI